MSSFRPSARAIGPDERSWEIYVYKVRLHSFSAPNPVPSFLSVVPSFGAEIEGDLLDGLFYVLMMIPRLIMHLLIDLPVGLVRAALTKDWTVEAISWSPFKLSYCWTTSKAARKDVVQQVKDSLEHGAPPRPSNAKLLSAS